MRITVVEFAGRGGMIHYAYQLCRALAEAGAQVTLVTDRNYELEGLPHPFRRVMLFRLWDPKPPKEMGFSWVASALRKLRRPVRALRYYREWLRLAAYLRREPPDLVQFGDLRFPLDLLPVRLLRRQGLLLVDICHNVYPFAVRPSGELVRSSVAVRALYRRLYREFRLVFVHFQENRRRFLEAFPLDPEKVVTIPHGNEEIFLKIQDPSRTPGLLRRELDLAPEDRVVLFFGSLTRYKGVDLLVRAFPRILREEPRARLVLAGFPLADFRIDGLQALVRSLGVEERVRLVSRYLPAGEIGAWMELAAVAVFPYRTVFQSGALHVAQTFGVPMVATRVGAIPEVVIHRESGLLVPPEDPESLAAAVVEVLRNPDLALRLGTRAHQEARSRFAWERVAREVVAAYEKLLGKPVSPVTEPASTAARVP